MLGSSTVGAALDGGSQQAPILEGDVNNNSAARNPIVVDNGVSMTDAGSPYGNVNIGQPQARTAMDDAMLNVMLQQMQNPPAAAGPGIRLDDFGNPIKGGAVNGGDEEFSPHQMYPERTLYQMRASADASRIQEEALPASRQQNSSGPLFLPQSEVDNENARLLARFPAPDSTNQSPVLLTTEGQRRQSILGGTSGIISIGDNPRAVSTEPFYEWRMQEQVTKYAPIIDSMAGKYGVDADLVKAIMYVETTHGWYDAWAAPFDANKSILPMNVRSDDWAGLGYSREDLKVPQINIEAGVRIIKGITEQLDDPNVRKVATFYNSLAKDQVTNYGARVEAVYTSKPWNDPALTDSRNARQNFRQQYRSGNYSNPIFDQFFKK